MVLNNNELFFDYIEDEDIETKAYRKLWRGVLYQLFWDIHRKPVNDTQELHYSRAVFYLEHYKEDFNILCFFADIDPEYLLEKMAKVKTAKNMGIISNFESNNKMQFTLDKILRRITGFYA